MLKTSLLILMFGITMPHPVHDKFKKDQMRYSRVRAAFANCEAVLTASLEKRGLPELGLPIYLRAIKDEQVLEVFVQEDSTNTWQLFRSYKFCSNSGEIGPKRQQGDMQIPEGLYHVDRFNPHSYFYLSLGINYPNKSDKLRKTGRDPGGDIFIHGDCVTIGCIPITDKYIEEVYVMAVEAKNAGQSKIPVHFYPSRLTPDGLTALKSKYPAKEQHFQLWDELAEAYQHFDEKKELPTFGFSTEGAYVVK